MVIFLVIPPLSELNRWTGPYLQDNLGQLCRGTPKKEILRKFEGGAGVAAPPDFFLTRPYEDL